jgi:type IV secretory pathway VirB3-like protein
MNESGWCGWVWLGVGAYVWVPFLISAFCSRVVECAEWTDDDARALLDVAEKALREGVDRMKVCVRKRAIPPSYSSVRVSLSLYLSLSLSFSLSLSLSLSLYLSIYLSVYLSISPCCFSFSAQLAVDVLRKPHAVGIVRRPHVALTREQLDEVLFGLSVWLAGWLSVCLAGCLSVWLAGCLSVCTCVCACVLWKMIRLVCATNAPLARLSPAGSSRCRVSTRYTCRGPLFPFAPSTAAPTCGLISATSSSACRSALLCVLGSVLPFV